MVMYLILEAINYYYYMMPMFYFLFYRNIFHPVVSVDFGILS